MSEDLVVVVSGGRPPRPEAALGVPVGVPVIAADGGVEHARALGLDVTLVVGDLDSAAPEAVAAAEAAGARVERHPEGKDETDLELALEAALALSKRHVLVLAGDGGRLDHLLAALLLLGSSRWDGVEIDAEIGTASVHVIRRERMLEGRPGELLSLLPLGGRAEDVRTEGLAFPLAGETLESASTRGVSNVFATDTARVSLERGVLLAVRPGPGEGDDPL